jgi:hypothetical protein
MFLPPDVETNEARFGPRGGFFRPNAPERQIPRMHACHAAHPAGGQHNDTIARPAEARPIDCLRKLGEDSLPRLQGSFTVWPGSLTGNGPVFRRHSHAI